MGADSTKPHVLIVGAGLGGLTLAQCLRKQGISYEIFERDVDMASRSQGYAIGMHSILNELEANVCSDMPPLRESTHHLAPLNLPTQIALYARSTRIGVQDSPETPVLRANRARLRKWLATQIPVQWNKRLQSIEESGEQVTLRFEDGSHASGDIVVGADGVHSVVREYLIPQTVLNYVPRAVITGQTVLTGAAMERQLSLAHSCYIAMAEPTGDTLFAGLNQVNDDQNSGDYYWSVSWQDHDVGKPDHWLKTASKSEKLARARLTADDLDPKLAEIIHLTPEEGIPDAQIVYRDADISELPVGRVTLLGDAAHPMTPFRGEGGMHAFRDAINLSKLLSQVDRSDPQSIQATMRSYQEEMLPRGRAAVQASRGAIENNQDSRNKAIMWGYAAVPLPEEKISLEECRS
ncbi:putative monooxygenase [Xylariomycetidae sp. FL0641]|nr:putative monooxygenase [Xylariomycetidae sp. FL0641]